MADRPAWPCVIVPPTFVAAVRGRGGAGGAVTRAIEPELEREQLGAYLSELDDEHGPVPEATLLEARRAWRKR
jgi:hypothetical protein